MKKNPLHTHKIRSGYGDLPPPMLFDEMAMLLREALFYADISEDLRRRCRDILSKYDKFKRSNEYEKECSQAETVEVAPFSEPSNLSRPG